MISQFQTIGSRDYQEDRMVVIPNFAGLEHFTMCLVCDGHGGSATSEFLIVEYPKQLVLAFDQYRKIRQEHKKDKQKPEQLNVTIKLMGIALERCILMWDVKCFGEDAHTFKSPDMRDVFEDPNARSKFFKKHYDRDKWEAQGLLAGSTLNCMIVDLKKSRAHLLNIGDSRTTWIIDESAIDQTIDHSVRRKIEKTRGVTCNVIDGRLEGILAMSNAVGDNDEMLLGRVKRDYATRVVSFKGQSFRAVTASDGLFDVRSNHQLLYDTYENATDMAESALKSIAEAEELKRAEMVENGLMTLAVSQTPYEPKFVDNVSIIYVKIPKNYTFVSTKQSVHDEDDIARLVRETTAQLTIAPKRKTSLKKNSKKKK